MVFIYGPEQPGAVCQNPAHALKARKEPCSLLSLLLGAPFTNAKAKLWVN